MIPVAEAIARITAALAPMPSEIIAVSDSVGRVLAEPVLARVSQPPANISAMDGYAVRADDFRRRLPMRLKVIGSVAAGHGFRGTVQPGEAVRIFTGAAMPAGTTAVLIQEAVQADDNGGITVTEAVAAGHHVRPMGQDFEVGTIGLPAGRTIGVRDVALIAAMNVPLLRVRQRPRVAILATGDEVVLPGEPLGRHQIISSNSPALGALVTACGGLPINLGVAGDSADALLAAAASAEGSDLLVTSGGASVGDHDLVHAVLGKRGDNIDFWKVAMRPGKPLLFGRTGSVPLLGLPGNPVSCLVTAFVFLRPALRALLGQPAEANGLRPTARLGQALPANDQRQTYLRATLSHDWAGDLTATPFPRQDSAMLTPLAAADCLIIRPPAAEAADAGSRVEILPLGASIIGV
ncbi:MAG: gephyrin-like molybdotransferase Glp [Rhodospirillaceae bacterium]